MYQVKEWICKAHKREFFSFPPIIFKNCCLLHILLHLCVCLILSSLDENLIRCCGFRQEESAASILWHRRKPFADGTFSLPCWKQSVTSTSLKRESNILLHGYVSTLCSLHVLRTIWKVLPRHTWAVCSAVSHITSGTELNKILRERKWRHFDDGKGNEDISMKTFFLPFLHCSGI